MGNAETLRELAQSLRNGAPPLVIVMAALDTPAPAGDVETVRDAGRDVNRCARELNDLSVDLDKLRERRLPEIWSGGADTQAAEERLRATARHVEHASEVLGRISGSLIRLAGGLSFAKRLDTAGREDLHTAIAVAQAVDSEHLGTAISMQASAIDRMADGAEKAETVSADEGRLLSLYAAEAGMSWLTTTSDRTDGRMPPEEILLRYHQPHDPGGMVEFRFLNQTREMTATERDMLSEFYRTPWDLKDANDIRNDAWDQAEERYPGGEAHNGPGDAWRHAYWTARQAQRFGEDWAERFTTAHEGDPGAHRTQVAMDLHNNQVGLRIARENPDATPEELGDLIAQAVENGELVAMAEVNGEQQLYYTDEPRPGQ